MGKRGVLRLTVVILIALLGCTMLSAWVYDTLLPEVTVYTPESGTVNGERYPLVVPASCVYQDNNGDFVFRLKEVDGKWKVKRSSVTVLDSDGRYTAIRRATSDEIQIAAFPSRALQDGAEVKVAE
ncbi:MAG: hypothetical protein LUF28_06500 [Clostridiales bacterium]|nr:hypothetical protein [Clostridiales bacterium]